MEEKTIFLVWLGVVLLLALNANFMGYRNYKKNLLGSWVLVSNALILAWGLGQLLSVYLVFEELKIANVAIFALVFLGNAINSSRKQVLSYAGLAVAAFGLLAGAGLSLLPDNGVFSWAGRMLQLTALGFWTTFLLLPKIESKFKKDEQKLQNLAVEKENLLAEKLRESDARKQEMKTLTETVQRHQEQARKLSILSLVAKSMGSSTDRELILQSIPEELQKIWKVQTCGFYLWDEELQVLVLRYGSGYEAGLLNRLSFKKGEGLIGWVAVEGRPVRLADPAGDVRFKDKYSQLAKNKKMDFKTTLVVPINTDDKNLGVIELINYASGFKDKASQQLFSDDDEHILYTLANQLSLFLENIGQYEESREAYLDIIRSLVNAIEARDPYTRGHSEQTTKYAVAIAQKLNLPAEAVETIRYAASLHDIGKIGIKETILKKAKKLTADEYSHIKNHPFMGAQILKPIKSLQEVIPIVYHHHERYDGQGYLDGLQKDEIPIGARILCVADSFEAMTSDRPYHKGMQKHEAMTVLRGATGTQFDPQVVDAFLDVLQEETSIVIGARH